MFQFLSKKNLARIADNHVSRIASCFTVYKICNFLRYLPIYLINKNNNYNFEKIKDIFLKYLDF